MLVRPTASSLLAALALAFAACSSDQTPIKAEDNAAKLDKSSASWSDAKNVRPDPPLDAGMDSGEPDAGPTDAGSDGGADAGDAGDGG